jgi:hypothetical protein
LLHKRSGTIITLPWSVPLARNIPFSAIFLVTAFVTLRRRTSGRVVL